MPVVLHCFSSVDRLDEAIERGYYCSFAGNVAYPSAGELRRGGRGAVPDDRILAETDAPTWPRRRTAAAPTSRRTSTCTLAVLAAERGVEPAALAAQIDRNADRVFGL